jgi:hypothetical protein
MFSWLALLIFAFLVLVIVGAACVAIATTTKRRPPEIQPGKPCLHCGAPISPLNRHCPQCGQEVAPVEGDRKELEKMG